MSPPVNQEPASAGLSRSEHAYRLLRDQIITLQLPPGAPIREDQLTAELGLGRTPLREAIKRLEAESLIAIYPRRGTFVAEVHIRDHALIADVRRRLEGHAARRAAQRATNEDRDALTRLHDELAEVAHGEREALMELDASVHRGIYATTHNRYLEGTLNQYYNLALRIWCLCFDQLPELTAHISEHADLLDVIVKGSARQAERIAVRHVDHFEQAIRQVL